MTSRRSAKLTPEQRKRDNAKRNARRKRAKGEPSSETLLRCAGKPTKNIPLAIHELDADGNPVGPAILTHLCLAPTPEPTLERKPDRPDRDARREAFLGRRTNHHHNQGDS